MTRNWDALAEAVRTRRLALGLRQKDMASCGGPSYETMRMIEKKGQQEPRAPQRRTITGLDKALGWTPGTAQAILNGQPPPTALGAAEETNTARAIRPVTGASHLTVHAHVTTGRAKNSATGPAGIDPEVLLPRDDGVRALLRCAKALRMRHATDHAAIAASDELIDSIVPRLLELIPTPDSITWERTGEQEGDG